MSEVTRPPARWHGGKFAMAHRIACYFPRHRGYTEAFGGAAGILLQKPRAHEEIYNDLDDDIVNLFRILQDPASERRLLELLRATPFARREFEIAYDPAVDQVERARRLVIRSFMGFGSNAHSLTNRGHQSTGFRSKSNRLGTTPAQDWWHLPDTLPAVAERMRGVVIEHRDAILILRRHDGPEVLHYVDPPYMHDTRTTFKSGKQAYKHELDGGGHVALLDCVQHLAGMVALSGYAHSLYDDTLTGWRRIEIAAYADGARPRTEVLWLNPACCEALDREGRTTHAQQVNMFAEA